MQATRLHIFLIWALLLRRPAGAPSLRPRCGAKGYYQDAPITFACGGSHGEERLLLESGKNRQIVVPVGTEDFDLTVQGEEPGAHASLSFSGGKIGSDGKLQGVHVDLTVDTNKSSLLPALHRAHFSGITTGPIVLSLEAVLDSSREATYVLHYFYKPFAIGPHCKQGGAPIGCTSYDENWAREVALRLAFQMRSKYRIASIAWSELVRTHMSDVAIPYHKWCSLLRSVEEKLSRPECDVLFKFITHGGLEVNRKHLYKEDFNWWFKLPEIAHFDHKCCSRLKGKYLDAQKAWADLGKMALKLHSDCPCTGMWNTCRGLPSPPDNHKDYFYYLNSVSYDSMPLSSVDHCWAPATQFTTTKPQNPVSTEASTSAAAAVAETSPRHRASTTTPAPPTRRSTTEPSRPPWAGQGPLIADVVAGTVAAAGLTGAIVGTIVAERPASKTNHTAAQNDISQTTTPPKAFLRFGNQANLISPKMVISSASRPAGYQTEATSGQETMVLGGMLNVTTTAASTVAGFSLDSEIVQGASIDGQPSPQMIVMGLGCSGILLCLCVTLGLVCYCQPKKRYSSIGSMSSGHELNSSRSLVFSRDMLQPSRSTNASTGASESRQSVRAYATDNSEHSRLHSMSQEIPLF